MSPLCLSGLELSHLLPLSGRELRRTLEAMVAAARRERPMPPLELLLVRDAAMAQYNAEHMGLPGPTNVLSFPAAGDHMPGSLIVSVDTLHREARAYGQPVREHLLRLLAHGLGHVAGYEHSPEMDDFCYNILQNHTSQEV